MFGTLMNNPGLTRIIRNPTRKRGTSALFGVQTKASLAYAAGWEFTTHCFSRLQRNLLLYSRLSQESFVS